MGQYRRTYTDELKAGAVDRLYVKWAYFLGQICGLAKMPLVSVHAAFRVSLWSKYAAPGVRLSRAV